MPDLESEVVKTSSGRVIGTIEYSTQYDLWYVRSIHSRADVKLFHDYGHAVRWIHEMHAEYGARRAGPVGGG